jgi:hypothetical protein
VTESGPDLPPAGWYPDPAGAAALRWWNGVTWSDTTHPHPGHAAPTGTPTSPPEIPTAAAWSSPTPIPAYEPAAPPSPRPPRRGWIVATAALLVLALLAGLLLWLPQALSDRHELDTDAVASQVSDALSARMGVQIGVACPHGIPLETGSTFTCTASAPDGSTQDIVVTQTNDQGDVTWAPSR